MLENPVMQQLAVANLNYMSNHTVSFFKEPYCFYSDAN